MISPEKKQAVLSRIKEIESFIILHVDRDIPIGDLCAAIRLESVELAKSSDSLAPILRTSLVINWRESAMKSRYDRFVREFPKISTLAALKRVMDSREPLAFCNHYLNIKANSSAPDKNPKYRLLKELTNGFLEYQMKHDLSSEIEAIRHWSARVDFKTLKKDFIGGRQGVGPGVVGNIKLNLGEPVIKLDRHVIGVMKKFLEVDIPLDSYNEFATSISKDPRYLDCLLFEYGKANNISAGGECVVGR